MGKRLAGGIAAGLAFAAAGLAVIHGFAVARYVMFGIRYGDWLNDWVTHLPTFIETAIVTGVR